MHHPIDHDAPIAADDDRLLRALLVEFANGPDPGWDLAENSLRFGHRAARGAKLEIRSRELGREINVTIDAVEVVIDTCAARRTGRGSDYHGADVVRRRYPLNHADATSPAVPLWTALVAERKRLGLDASDGEARSKARLRHAVGRLRIHIADGYPNNAAAVAFLAEGARWAERREIRSGKFANAGAVLRRLGSSKQAAEVHLAAEDMRLIRELVDETEAGRDAGWEVIGPVATLEVLNWPRGRVLIVEVDDKAVLVRTAAIVSHDPFAGISFNPKPSDAEIAILEHRVESGQMKAYSIVPGTEVRRAYSLNSAQGEVPERLAAMMRVHRTALRITPETSLEIRNHASARSLLASIRRRDWPSDWAAERAFEAMPTRWQMTGTRVLSAAGRGEQKAL